MSRLKNTKWEPSELYKEDLEFTKEEIKEVLITYDSKKLFDFDLEKLTLYINKCNLDTINEDDINAFRNIEDYVISLLEKIENMI